jgi:hypothetical protein
MGPIETWTLIILGIGILFISINAHVLRQRRKLAELNHKIEFVLKFINPIPPDEITSYEMVIIQDLKEQCRITGTITNGNMTRLTTTNDFIYEHYTGAELEQFILALFKHHTENPHGPLPYPLEGIKCVPMIPFDMNS